MMKWRVLSYARWGSFSPVPKLASSFFQGEAILPARSVSFLRSPFGASHCKWHPELFSHYSHLPNHSLIHSHNRSVNHSIAYFDLTYQPSLTLSISDQRKQMNRHGATYPYPQIDRYYHSFLGGLIPHLQYSTPPRSEALNPHRVTPRILMTW